MHKEITTIRIGKNILPVDYTSVLIIGSGCASLACAVDLCRMGCHDLVVATDNRYGGTSRNAGSDKQTYYRLSDASPVTDSPYAMAASYVESGAMHGDIAFVEAQCSLRAFYHLVSIGVPFPHNRYGGYTGYKTDNDPDQRGTSLGPFTSRRMVEKLEDEAKLLDVPIYDHYEAVRLLMAPGDRIAGALFLNTEQNGKERNKFSIILADHVVLGTGGPGILYAASVYPVCQWGAIGLAMEIGAEAGNLTESQFGIASKGVRWNLSGSYQQVLPNYYSSRQDGTDKRAFLVPFFDTWQKLTQAVFLKGYQWPFDAEKISNHGSSLIDLLVYHETQVLGRRVFIDFRQNLEGNPGWQPWGKDCVSPIAIKYLEQSQAWAETPLKRLQLINPDALQLFLQRGIDLASEPLEIDVCAQHNNGGLVADIWWESTNVKRLYPIGEVNGSHGVRRPGGSALNAAQVGALRAATRIIGYGSEDRLDIQSTLQVILGQVEPLFVLVETWADRYEQRKGTPVEATQMLDKILSTVQQRMTRAAGPIRRYDEVERACEEAEKQLAQGLHGLALPPSLFSYGLRLRHLLIAQLWYMKAIKGYLDHGGGSRGSYLVVDTEGTIVHPLLPVYRMRKENQELRTSIQVLFLNKQGALCERYVPCRPIPDQEFWFERVWADFRSNKYLQATNEEYAGLHQP